MDENEIKELQDLQKEIQSISSELKEMIEKDPAELTSKDRERFLELKDSTEKVKGAVSRILNVITTSRERLDEINKTLATYETISPNEVENEPGERTKLEERIANLEGASLAIKSNYLDSLVQKANVQIGKSTLIQNKKSKEERMEEKKKAIHDFFETTDPNPKVLLMESQTWSSDDYSNGENTLSTLRTPISASAVRLMEITGASETYNYSKSKIVSIDFDHFKWGCKTRFSTEQDLLKERDFDGVNAVRMYQDKVAEVASDPRYQREVVFRIPVYLEVGPLLHEIPEPEYVEISCKESELAQRLGMLAMDLLPELPKRDLSATEYFQAASDPSLAESKRGFTIADFVKGREHEE